MPGLVNNTAYSDNDIANIISYLNNAFAKNSKGISPARIKELRDQKPKNGALFTVEELLKIKD